MGETVTATPAAEPLLPPSRRRAAYVRLAVPLLIIAALMLLMKLPSLGRPHREGDEQVYLSLARNLLDTGSYSLQGTQVLRKLSPQVYDRPLFHHPPLFVFLCAPFVRWLPDNSAVMVAWMGHFLFIVGLLLLLWTFLGAAQWPLIVTVLALAGLDPLMVFASQKIWLDAPLAGLGTLAVALFVLALRSGTAARRRALLLGSGLTMGLAVLVKVPALVLIAIIALALITHGDHRLGRRGLAVECCLWFLAPLVVICAPWFIKFHGTYGMLLPDWIAPDPWMIANNPFIRTVMDRPFYYYLREWLLLTPLFLLPVAYFVHRRSRPGRDAVLMAGWFLFVIGTFTYLAVFSGHSYQMRFVTLACAPAYVLLGISLREFGGLSRRWLLFLTLFGLATNTITSLFYLAHPSYADIVSLIEILRGMT